MWVSYLLILITVCIILTKKNLFYQIPALILFCGISEFFKRYLYLYNFNNIQSIYYLILFVPDLIFLIIIFLNSRFQRGMLIYVTTIIFFLGLYSLLVNNNLMNVIVNIKSYLYYMMILCLPKNNCDLDQKKLDFYVFVFILIGLITVVYALYQHFCGYPVWEINWFKNSPTGMKINDVTNNGKIFRSYSMFSGIQEFGLILIYVISLTYYYFKNQLNNNLKWAIIAFITIGILTTAAKGIWVCFLLTIFFCYLNIVSKPKIYVLILFVPSIILALVHPAIVYTIVVFIRGYFPEKVTSYIDPITLMPRIRIVQECFLNTSLNMELLLGNGIGSTRTINGVTTVFDNMFLYIIFEFGIIGFVIFVMVIYRVAKNIQKTLLMPITCFEEIFLRASIFFITAVILNCNIGQTLMIRTIFILFCLSCYYPFYLTKKYRLIYNI